MKIICCCHAGVLLALALPAAARATTYTITDLGTLGGDTSQAFGINDLGQVVGYSLTSNGQTQAFIYSGGAMTGLPFAAGTNWSQAAGINNSGQITGDTGTQDLSGNVSNEQGFLYSAGQSVTLIPSFGGNAINDQGVVAGIGNTSDGVTQAYLFENGNRIDLGALNNTQYAYANAINSSGQVAGASQVSLSTPYTTYEHAFFYSGGTMMDLGTLGGTGSRAFGINDSGEVVGTSFVNDTNQHAFLYTNGQMTDLGALTGTDSVASAINNGGEIVGTISFAGGQFPLGSTHAFVYANGTMYDLNSLVAANSGWVLAGAQAINSNGQIVGTGLFDGKETAYLLTPTPEPSSLVLLGIGATALLIAARRRYRS